MRCIFDRRWMSKYDMFNFLEGRAFEGKYLYESCARKSRVFVRIPQRQLESRLLMSWAYSDTINDVGVWQTSVECLLGDWSKTRNFLKEYVLFVRRPGSWMGTRHSSCSRKELADLSAGTGVWTCAERDSCLFKQALYTFNACNFILLTPGV